MTQNGASKFLVKWWIFQLFRAMIWKFGLILPHRTSPKVTQSYFGHRKLTSKSLNRHKQKFGWSIFSCTLNPTDGSTWGKTGNGFVYFITYTLFLIVDGVLGVEHSGCGQAEVGAERVDEDGIAGVDGLKGEHVVEILTRVQDLNSWSNSNTWQDSNTWSRFAHVVEICTHGRI